MFIKILSSRHFKKVPKCLSSSNFFLSSSIFKMRIKCLSNSMCGAASSRDTIDPTSASYCILFCFISRQKYTQYTPLHIHNMYIMYSMYAYCTPPHIVSFLVSYPSQCMIYTIPNTEYTAQNIKYTSSYCFLSCLISTIYAIQNTKYTAKITASYCILS